MKLIIAGSRGLTVFSDFIEATADFHQLEITEVVSGTAAGIDLSGEYFAKKFNITLKRFPADWNKYGKAAGPKRNQEMAKYADALLLIWTGCEKTSRGSKNMRDEMLKLVKPVYEVILRKHNT